ncbi:MAG: TatD family hydrolase [Deltaproteobacteria bacterium]|nr:TatD family hydrolase [Deltaproteobacteria bacterium]MDE0035646.1 TatD family hydrolase [Deltaproteobacteria bacterium]
MLIDAHAHLDHYDDPQEALTRIEDRRILTLANAMDPDSYRRNLALAKDSAFVLPSFGVHPRRATEHSRNLSDLRPMAEQSPMLGELGLDFHWVRDTETYPHQIRVFEFLIREAAERDKVVNLHTKGAERRILDTLRAFGVKKAIIHWYSGPMDVLDEMIGEGYLFTVGVEVLYSEKIRDVARAVPPRQLLSETDNPGGHRWLAGEVAPPDIIADVVAEVARLKGLPPEKMEAVIQANFLRLISGDPRLAGAQALLERQNDNATRRSNAVSDQ